MQKERTEHIWICHFIRVHGCMSTEHAQVSSCICWLRQACSHQPTAPSPTRQAAPGKPRSGSHWSSRARHAAARPSVLSAPFSLQSSRHYHSWTRSCMRQQDGWRSCTPARRVASLRAGAAPSDEPTRTTQRREQGWRALRSRRQASGAAAARRRPPPPPHRHSHARYARHACHAHQARHPVSPRPLPRRVHRSTLRWTSQKGARADSLAPPAECRTAWGASADLRYPRTPTIAAASNPRRRARRALQRAGSQLRHHAKLHRPRCGRPVRTCPQGRRLVRRPGRPPTTVRVCWLTRLWSCRRWRWS